jgi:hypothetical protein
MATLYEAIGRLVVRFVRVRYRRQLRVAAAVGVLAALGAGYAIASREPPEG